MSFENLALAELLAVVFAFPEEVLAHERLGVFVVDRQALPRVGFVVELPVSLELNEDDRMDHGKRKSVSTSNARPCPRQNQTPAMVLLFASPNTHMLPKAFFRSLSSR